MRVFTASILLCFCLIIGGSLLGHSGNLVGTQSAQAQGLDFNPLKPVFRLFKRRGREQARPPADLRGQKPSRRLKRQGKRSGSAKTRKARAPKIEELPKDPDARKVLIVGDTLADGLYNGLKTTFAKTPNIVVSKLTKASYGLSKPLEPDWPTRLETRMTEDEPDLVVIMLGARDRRSIEGPNGRAEFRSDAWRKAYRFETARMVAAVRNLRKPLIWIGLAPAPGPQRTADFLTFNEIYANQANPAGGEFLDIWELFLGEDGKYASHGADLEGNRTQLRASDGIYFTNAGYRKLAYFVERRIASILGDGPTAEELNNSGDPDFLLLTGINSQPGEVLAGALDEEEEVASADSLRYKLMIKGEALPRVAGRADDYSWSARN
ncbi:MAG: GDSL-type esterase/lipase family protein [Stappiaceae bacterium]